jgi:hypothetical protein
MCEEVNYPFKASVFLFLGKMGIMVLAYRFVGLVMLSESVIHKVFRTVLARSAF